MAARFLITGGGSVTWDASNTAIWSATSGGGTGASVPGSGDTVTMDGSSGGGTVTLGYNPTVTSITMGAYTGTFAASTFSPTMATFSASGTGTRTLNMGSGTWTLTGSGTTIWQFTTTTGLTFNAGSSTVDFSYSGSTGTRTITGGGANAIMNIFRVSAGTDIISVNNVRCTDFNFTGFTGSLTMLTNGSQASGSVTFPVGMTTNASSVGLSMTTASSANLATNGITINFNLTILATGGTVTLKSNLILGSTRTLTLTNGTLDASDSGANHNVTCGLFSSSNSNARSITMGGGTWTITGTSGTPWTFATATNLTFNAGTSTLVISDTGASSKTIQTGSRTFNNLTITGGGAGAVIFGGAPTFNVFTISAPKTVSFSATQTFTFSSFIAVGSAGNVITINSTSAGSAAILSKSSGIVSSDYLSIQDSTAQGGATWYAGANSTNVSGNRGWQFSTQDVSKANFFQVM
jgi:hypothetical protein